MTLNVLDELKRVPGTTNVQIFGAKDYAMRIWLRPDRLAQLQAHHRRRSRARSTSRTRSSPPARSARRPTGGPQELVYTITTQGRLCRSRSSSRTSSCAPTRDGSTLRLKDVARVELGSKDYDFIGRVNGKPPTLVGIFLQPGANALEVAEERQASTVARPVAALPRGPRLLDPVRHHALRRGVDPTRWSKTLAEAMVLVFLVVFLFLQNWRATLIPIIAVPVSLIGTFAGLLVLGYSINTLTLFGMVLAIGIVVDDAIVVLENVERIMHEEHLAAREAAIKAMREVTGPVIAIVLVLCAVFVPIAFLGGLTGELYRQFAVTISIAVVISGIVALTLTPCAVRADPQARARAAGPLLPGLQPLVRPRHRPLRRRRRLDAAARRASALLLFVGMVALTVGLWRITPGSLVPDEDQGYYIAAVILPDGASLQRTDKVVRRGASRSSSPTRSTRTSSPSPASTSSAAASATTPRRSSSRRSTGTSAPVPVHGAGGRALHEDRPHQGSAGARLRPAADLRPRHRGRLRVLHPEPRRRRRRSAWPR